jgi:hypothetical protein
VGAGIPLATGAALSAKLRKSGQVGVTFFGDGAVDGGTTALMSLISDFRNESANRFGRGCVPGA